MSLIPVLVTVALLGGLALAVRIIGEQAARQRAEARVRELEERQTQLEEIVSRAGAHEREWLGVLAHELRSPIGAILGYSELLRDGALGEIGERGSDALLRVAGAAEQILRLVEGIEDLALIRQEEPGAVEVVAARELLDEAVSVLQFDAESRDVRLRVDAAELSLATRRDAAARALLLAFSAAVKVSGGRDLVISARDIDGVPTILVSGTALRPDADDPATLPDGRPMSGAGLRLALARSAATPISGSVSLRAASDGADLVLALPRL
jgi:signal transduction histidine kinase